MIAKTYILFDGTCGFCMNMASRIVKADSHKCFFLVSTSSSVGKELLQKHDLAATAIHSIILLEGDNFWTKSKALRKILIRLPQWKIMGSLMFLLPVFLMDWIYDMVAAVRQRLSSADNCKMPDSKLRERFIT